MPHDDMPPLRDPFAMEPEDDGTEVNRGGEDDSQPVTELRALRDPFAREVTPVPVTPVPVSTARRSKSPRQQDRDSQEADSADIRSGDAAASSRAPNPGAGPGGGARTGLGRPPLQTRQPDVQAGQPGQPDRAKPPAFSGREITLREMPAGPSAPAAPPVSPHSAIPPTAHQAPTSAASTSAPAAWLGREVTMQEMPAGPSTPAPSTQAPAPWLGREATMQEMPAGPAAPTSPAPESTAPWLGREVTMQEMPAGPSAQGPASPPGSAAPWLGREATMQEMPAGPDSSGKPAIVEPWIGREVTLQQMQAVPQSKERIDPDGEWIGREVTMAGPAVTPLPDAAARATPTGFTHVHVPGSPTPTPSGRSGTPSDHRGRKGTSHSLDTWHMQGRKGTHTGQTWGDWEIGGLLGEGGMGAVYRALQKSLKRRVALKVLSPNLAADNRLLQRFEQEARISSTLSSPNIVHVYAAGEWEGNHFFAMEFVEGTDLYDIIKQRKDENRPFKPEESADIILQAARGLSEAGKYGIVHRDIKPPNLMITKQGLVKIADFGIVKVLGESQLTMEGQAVGTPSYVSPEQGRGEATVDQRSDLYSLGVVFYELLCGRKPFDGSTPNALIYQHCFEEPPLPKSLNPDISDEYQAVVLRCLQKKSENRYQDADALVKDLEDIRNGNMVKSVISNYKMGTGADEAKRENMSWAQRNLLKLVAAAVLVLLVGGGLIIWYTMGLADAASQANRLREVLKDLDKVAPLPADADGLLVKLERVAPDHGRDADLVRWRLKVDRVNSLSKQLHALDAPTIDAKVRHAAKPANSTIISHDVGAAEVNAARWSKALATAQRSEDELRDIFHRAEAEVLDLPHRDRLSPLLDQLALLVPAEDPQALSWKRTLGEFDLKVKSLTDKFNELAAKPSLSEADLQSLTQLLAVAKPLLGSQDEHITKGETRLADIRGRIGRYRAALKERFAKEDQPSKSSQEAVKFDLAAFRALVDVKDSDLVGWDQQIAAANAVHDDLKKDLGKLDQPPLKGQTLELALIKPNADTLARLERLALPGDADVRRWQERIQASRDYLNDLSERLRPLDKSDPLSQKQQAELAEAMERYAAKGALEGDAGQRWRRRLDDEKARVIALRQSLTAFNSQIPISTSMRQGLDRLTIDVGDADPDVKTWRTKLSLVDSLRSQLASLDQTGGAPIDIGKVLERLRGEIGNDDADVVRWIVKVRRLDAAVAALHVLDKHQPLPGDVAQNLAIVHEVVGDKDLTWRAWQDKFNRIGALKAALSQLPTTYAQSPAASDLVHAEFNELRLLIGDDDADLPGWADRLAVLDGPGRPAWAAGYGRDAYGIWSDLDLGGGAVQRFRFVPPGKYLRGSPDKEVGRKSDEVRTQITISKAFWLAEDECTQALWVAVMGSNPSRELGNRLPVQRISWDDSQSFLTKLSKNNRTHPPVRLPTESEWEYACRAGSTGPYASAAPGDVSIDKIGWYAGNTHGETEEVKLRFPNPLGLYDMCGNVWEWCQDGYSSYSTALVVDPIGGGSEQRVVRGGSWGDSAAVCRAANRASLRPGVRSVYVGVRLAADIDWVIKPDGRALMEASASEAILRRKLEFGDSDGVHVTLLVSVPNPAQPANPPASRPAIAVPPVIQPTPPAVITPVPEAKVPARPLPPPGSAIPTQNSSAVVIPPIQRGRLPVAAGEAPAQSTTPPAPSAPARGRNGSAPLTAPATPDRSTPVILTPRGRVGAPAVPPGSGSVPAHTAPVEPTAAPVPAPAQAPALPTPNSDAPAPVQKAAAAPIEPAASHAAQPASAPAPTPAGPSQAPPAASTEKASPPHAAEPAPTPIASAPSAPVTGAAQRPGDPDASSHSGAPAASQRGRSTAPSGTAVIPTAVGPAGGGSQAATAPASTRGRATGRTASPSADDPIPRPGSAPATPAQVAAPAAVPSPLDEKKP
jgi:tRNA A-37 threonylcarbamoyl transferase component Bud32